MDGNFRPSGIEGLADMSWGTHFCLFYETKEDLLDFFIPFFKTGLQHNEFCLCVASEPLIAVEAERAMRQAIPDFEHYLAAGQIEITPHTDWYLKAGYFDEQRVLQGWIDKLDQALENGFSGVRFAANILLEKRDWESFARYEEKVEENLHDLRIEGLCAYNLNRCSAANVLDVMRHHQFTLARRDGTWEPLEGAQIKRAHEEALKLNSELEQRVAERTAELAMANEQLKREIIERKRSEDALRTDEYRLQAAIEAADIVLWERDLSSGHITWLGHHEKLLGFAPGELDDNTLASFEKRVHPEDIEGLRRIRQRALEEQSEYSHEYRVLWRDGSIHWIRAQGRFIYNEAGQPIRLYGAVLDITERKRAEEAVRKSEQVLREAESLGHTGSWEQNLLTGEIFNTPENLRLFFGDDRTRGANLEDYAQVVHPDDREYVIRRRVELLEEEGPGDIEYRVIWPDGSVHVIFGRATVVRDELGRAIRVYGTNVDITERKHAEEQLRQSESNFRTLADKSLQGILIYQDEKVLYANPAQSEIMGYTIEELESMSVAQFIAMVHPLDREPVIQQVRRRMAGDHNLSSVEVRVFRKDGSMRWLQTFSNPIEYNGRPAMLNTTIDITERKQAEEEIRWYAARMEVLAEFSRTFVEAGLDYHSILNIVARRTAELIGDSCVITSFSDDVQRSFPVAFYHPNPKALDMMHEALLHTWQGGTDTQRYQTLLAGNSIYIPTVEREEFQASLEPEFWTYFETIGISSLLIVPLKAQGRVIGTIGITRDRQGVPYTREDQLLLQSLADRAAMSIQNARLFEQVQAARERLEALSRRLLEVQESERRALTTELHDRVGQNLTGLSITLQNMKAILAGEAAQRLAVNFDEAQLLVEDTTRQIRDIMAELHLPELEDYGLAAALETYAERAASRGNLELVTNLQDLAPPPLPSRVRIALFRAAQEAISNVIKHADATQLEVSLKQQDGRIRLTVGDDGKGFDPILVSQKEPQTWGLNIMRERIESIGGKVETKSRPGEGTRVTFEVERSS